MYNVEVSDERWLVECSPKELREMPLVLDRVEKVKQFRLASVKEATREYAQYPTRFMEIKQPDSDYLIIPATSSEKRKYIPIGYTHTVEIIYNLVGAIDLPDFGDLLDEEN